MPSQVVGAGRGAPPKKQNTPPISDRRNPSNAPRIKPPRWLPAAIWIASLIPLAWLIYGFASDFFLNTRHFGSNPIKEMEHYTGKWALRFLILSLAITPAIRLTKQGWLIRYRRTWGLFAFCYALVHLTIYFVLDVELTWSDLVEDVAERLYITLGMLAFLLMVPLVLTSTKASIRRLGNRRWNAVHRLVFATVILGNVHYWMSVKRDIREPLLFSGIFAALILYRIIEWHRSRRSR